MGYSIIDGYWTDAGTLDAPYYVSPLKLANYAGRAKRFATTIGDGTATNNAGNTTTITAIAANQVDGALYDADTNFGGVSSALLPAATAKTISTAAPGTTCSMAATASTR